MGQSVEHILKKYTYRDYLAWPEDQPIELIDGVPYAMTPAPARIHQKIVVELLRQISTYLYGKTCEVYTAPFDVRLSDSSIAEEEIDSIVQPDISIICDKVKLDDKGCKGSPDLIIEVVSPSSVSVDYMRKLSLYEKYSVREYWIVHPVDQLIMVYKLIEEGKYARPDVYQIGEPVRIGIFEDLTVSLADVFREV